MKSVKGEAGEAGEARELRHALVISCYIAFGQDREPRLGHQQAQNREIELQSVVAGNVSRRHGFWASSQNGAGIGHLIPIESNR